MKRVSATSGTALDFLGALMNLYFCFCFSVYTYIQSRFYRSPEIILGCNYHMAIDMWSLGCILAELYTGFPIFPGENEQEQLSCIMEVLGVPDKAFVQKSSRTKLFFGKWELLLKNSQIGS